MNKNYTYNFSAADIKHNIEHLFYKKVSEFLQLKKNETISIVTGPDWERHIKNVKEFWPNSSIRICEINTDIFIKIYQESSKLKEIKVIHNTVEKEDSVFIDCDLTCTSDINVIENTLINQLTDRAGYFYHKAFIATVGLRSGSISGKYDALFRRLFGLLGASCQRILYNKNILSSEPPYYVNEIKFQLIKGRVKYYKCFSYNAGGGPMITLLIIYK